MEIIKMRIIENQDDRDTKVSCNDEKGNGNACHDYSVNDSAGNEIGSIKFQNGPVLEHGVNGLQHEHLLLIVLDRLQHFQNGEFRCSENALALTKIEEALMCLDKRTSDRKARKVEGLNLK